MFLTTLTVFTLLNGSPSISSAPDIDSNTFYRLTTSFQGACRSLDVVNDATDDQLRLAPTADVSGQHWKLTPVGGGYYRLTTRWQGETKSLDIVNDATDDKLWLAPSGDYSGQHWKLTSTSKGAVRLTTKWKGTNRSLDIVNDATDNTPIMAKTADVSGQDWYLYKESPVGSVPPNIRAGFNPKQKAYYDKYLDGDGIPILSSKKVASSTHLRTRNTMRKMLRRMPKVRNKLVALKVAIVLVAKGEKGTDVPDFHHLRGKKTADGRLYSSLRAWGATEQSPQLASEENSACNGGDHPNEDIFVHEFAHTLHMAMSKAYGKSFDDKLAKLYKNAQLCGRFANTYAQADIKEYFAEGVQSWFNLNAEALPSDSNHNHVNTRTELAVHDPGLHAFLAKYFEADDNNCGCHTPGIVQTVKAPKCSPHGASTSEAELSGVARGG